MLQTKNNRLLPWMVVAVVMTLAACGKKNNNVDPELPKDTIYQVQTITRNGIPLDSLVYLNNQLTELWSYDSDSNAYMGYTKFFYLPDGRLNTTDIHNGYFTPHNYRHSSDSITWLPGQVLDSFAFYSNETDLPLTGATDTFKLDNNNNLVLNGKKDTVTGWGYKQVQYREWVYTGNNVTAINNVDYFKAPGYPTTNTDNSFKFEYGSLINPLFEYFTHNPILTLYFPNFWLSQNNAILQQPIGNNKSYTRTISSTPLPGTNYVQEYVITGGSQPEKITYKFIKTVK